MKHAATVGTLIVGMYPIGLVKMIRHADGMSWMMNTDVPIPVRMVDRLVTATGRVEEVTAWAPISLVVTVNLIGQQDRQTETIPRARSRQLVVRDNYKPTVCAKCHIHTTLLLQSSKLIVAVNHCRPDWSWCDERREYANKILQTLRYGASHHSLIRKQR